MGHLGITSWPSIGSDILAYNFSIPAQAAMTPLSVQRPTGGNINGRGEDHWPIKRESIRR